MLCKTQIIQRQLLRYQIKQLYMFTLYYIGTVIFMSWGGNVCYTPVEFNLLRKGSSPIPRVHSNISSVRGGLNGLLSV